MPHCDEVGHLIRKVIDERGKITQHCMRTIHAEQNAIIQAARFGIAIEGSILYCKMEPCRTCAMSIIGAGIKKVICEKKYHASDDTVLMFAKSGVDLVVLSREVERYPDM
jgi:dCMP deaminase